MKTFGPRRLAHMITSDGVWKMRTMAPAKCQMSGAHYNDNSGDIEFEYDVTVVDGERGRRLAVVQVESMLEVVEWFSRRPSRPTTTT